MYREDKSSVYKNSKHSKNDGEHGDDVSTQPTSGKKLAVKKPAVTNKKTSVAAAVQSAFPSLSAMAIDKLFLDVSVTIHDLYAVLDRAKDLVRTKELVRGSTKSTFFKNAFVLNLPGGAVIRFHMVPNIAGKGALMQVVLNPNQMEPGDHKAIIKIFRSLFPLNAREIVAAMLVRRIDVCLQFGLSIEHLIIELTGAKAGAKVFVWTDSGGRLQTLYTGAVNSPKHGAAYDQIASDEYKMMVDEKPSRARARDQAELVFERTNRTGRTQFEHRCNFEEPRTLAQLAEMTTPFANYRIMELKFDDQKLDPAFCGYIDSVRLRGIYGTRQYWSERCGGKSLMKDQLADYESRLGALAVPWWKPEEYSASLLETLEKSAAWPFLRIMK